MGVKSIFREVLKWLPEEVSYKIIRNKIRINYDLPQNLVFKVAETESEVRQALTILHDSYVEVGLMNQEPSHLRLTKYHQIPTSIILIAKLADQVIGTLTIVRDSAQGLPADEIVDLSLHRSEFKNIAEISALAVLPKWRGKIFFPLLKFLYQVCVDDLKIKKLIVVSHSDWDIFYRAVALFQPLKNQVIHNYKFSNNIPVRALFLDLEKAYFDYAKIYAHQCAERNCFYYFCIYKEEKFIRNQFRFYSIISPSYDVPLLRTEPKSERFRLASHLNGELTLAGNSYPITVLNVSRHGLLFSFHKTQTLKDTQPLTLRIALGPFKVAEALIKPIWNKEQILFGGRVLNSDCHWFEYLQFLRLV